MRADGSDERMLTDDSVRGWYSNLVFGSAGTLNNERGKRARVAPVATGSTWWRHRLSGIL
jgi:hypothetical protein